MGDEITSKSKKSIIRKIIIMVVLLGIVVGIWAVKNYKKNIDLVGSDNPDFALNVTRKIDLEKLKSYGLPIIIDFGADSCTTCKEMAPVLKELNQELQGKAIIKFVDVRKYKDLAEGYPISVIPTQIFIDANGNPYKQEDPNEMNIMFYSLGDMERGFTVHEGGMTKEQLLNVLKEMGMK